LLNAPLGKRGKAEEDAPGNRKKTVAQMSRPNLLVSVSRKKKEKQERDEKTQAAASHHQQRHQKLLMFS